MKYTFITFLFLVVTDKVFSQGYDSIHCYNEYHKGWALVEKNGLYGFIDSKGVEVVPVIYSKISYYGEYQKDLALVERDGKKGFINYKGVEIVSP